MSNQPVPVDDKLILLGFPAENGMIVQHKHLALVSSLPQEEQRSGQAADSAADNNAVERLARVDNILGEVLELPIANSMSGIG